MSDEKILIRFLRLSAEGELVEIGKGHMDLDQYLTELSPALREVADRLEANPDASKDKAEILRMCADDFEFILSVKREALVTVDYLAQIEQLGRAVEQVGQLLEVDDLPRETVSNLACELRRIGPLIADGVAAVKSDTELVAPLLDYTWGVALSVQQYFLLPAKDAVKRGFKQLRNLQSARAVKQGPDLNTVERTLDALRQSNPSLSETRRRQLAAEELRCSVRTIMRRLEEKSSDA